MYGTISASQVTETHDKPLFTPGGVVRLADGKTYRYVKFVPELVAAAVGKPAYYSDTNTNTEGYLVTADYSEASSSPNNCMGIFVSVPTATLPWCWIQTGGLAYTLNDGTDIAAGASIYAVADDVIAAAALTGDAQNPPKIIGFAPLAITATSGYIYLTIVP